MQTMVNSVDHNVSSKIWTSADNDDVILIGPSELNSANGASQQLHSENFGT